LKSIRLASSISNKGEFLLKLSQASPNVGTEHMQVRRPDGLEKTPVLPLTTFLYLRTEHKANTSHVLR